MNTLYIFTDASFDPVSKRAVIGFLLSSSLDANLTAKDVASKSIEGTTNSKAEIEAALFAFNSLTPEQLQQHITLISDCQAISGLAERKGKLEKADFLSGRTGKELSQASLYRDYYAVTNALKLTVMWVKGHNKGANRAREGELFKVVDQTVRNRLRHFIETSRKNCKNQ